MAKVRRSLWFIAGFMFLTATLILFGKPVGLVIAYAIFLAIFLPLINILGKRLRTDVAAVALTDDKLASILFQGKTQEIFWKDIDSTTYQKVQNHSILQFALKPGSVIAGKRSFWTGADPVKPGLLLDALLPADQERLLAAIDARLKHESGATGLTDAVAEERAFNERLVALAPHTHATYALIALNVGVWLWMAVSGIGILHAPADQLLLWGGNAASEVQKGEWWRLLSATFIHGGILHIAMNMLGLYAAGTTVERIYGRRLFLLIYFGAGLLGSALSLHFSAQHAVSVGASGAVFGIAGALLVAYMQHRDKLPKASAKNMISGIGFFVIYSLMQGFGKTGIDNAAHVGGLIGGCLLAYILPERFDMAHYRKTFHSRSATALAAIATLVAWTATAAPKATVDQAGIFASAEYVQRGLAGFDAVMKDLQQEAKDVQSGKLTERDADARSRTVFAPKFRAVADDLSRTVFHPDDPRAAFVGTVKRMAEVLFEMNEMESVFVDGDPKPHPVDPQRMEKLSAEFAQLAERFQSQAKMLNKKRQ